MSGPRSAPRGFENSSANGNPSEPDGVKEVLLAHPPSPEGQRLFQRAALSGPFLLGAGLLRLEVERIFERRRSDTIGICRSLLKLAPDRSVNAQRYIWPRAFLIGRNLHPGKLVGRAV